MGGGNAVKRVTGQAEGGGARGGWQNQRRGAGIDGLLRESLRFSVVYICVCVWRDRGPKGGVG